MGLLEIDAFDRARRSHGDLTQAEQLRRHRLGHAGCDVIEALRTRGLERQHCDELSFIRARKSRAATARSTEQMSHRRQREQTACQQDRDEGRNRPPASGGGQGQVDDDRLAGPRAAPAGRLRLLEILEQVARRLVPARRLLLQAAHHDVREERREIGRHFLQRARRDPDALHEHFERRVPGNGVDPDAIS